MQFLPSTGGELAVQPAGRAAALAVRALLYPAQLCLEKQLSIFTRKSVQSVERTVEKVPDDDIFIRKSV